MEFDFVKLSNARSLLNKIVKRNLLDYLMNAYNLVRDYSWSHHIVEKHPKICPKRSSKHALEPSKFLIPKIQFAV